MLNPFPVAVEVVAFGVVLAFGLFTSVTTVKTPEERQLEAIDEQREHEATLEAIALVNLPGNSRDRRLARRARQCAANKLTAD